MAPIILFVYNRPWHTEQTLTALAANNLADQSALYIYADGPKTGETDDVLQNIQETRALIRRRKWCKEVFIIESESNRGLARSVIDGVTEIINKHGRVIVLEDDLVTHPFFLTYMNSYLDMYKDEEPVISLHGFMYPIKRKPNSPFFLKGADCWGWATWKRGWDLFQHDGQLLLNQLVRLHLTKEFNFNNSYDYTSLLEAQIKGDVDSWAIRWYASAFLAGKLTLYPPFTLIHNIGFDGTGTHQDIIINAAPDNFDAGGFEIKKITPVENKKIKKQIELFFKGPNFYLKLAKQKVKSYIKRNLFSKNE